MKHPVEGKAVTMKDYFAGDAKTQMCIRDRFMNMSRSVFNRKVNGIMGISPIEYIKNYRLNKAKSFIQSGMS